MMSIMIGRASLRLVLTVAIFSLLFGSSAAAPPCCSQNHSACASSGAKTYEGCKNQSDGKNVWLPDGSETRTCIPRGNSTACKIHNDCCGTLVCESISSNFRVKQCQHPIDACAFNNETTLCNSKSSCVFKDNKCVPNFDYTIKNPDNLPKDFPDNPACCSQNYRTCPTSSSMPRTQAACAAAPGKLVWLPGGDINTTCIERSKSTTCKVHEDCCGTLVCDGLAANVKKKQCYIPVDLCGNFTDATFCKTRSSCNWNGTSCVPNFDWTVNIPANKPLNIPDDPACCSQNYRTCSTSSSIPRTQAACAADPGKLVWLPSGDSNTTCIERNKTTTCKLHEDCCGTLVCDGLASNFKKKQCYHAVDLCASYTDEAFCETRSSCNWNGTLCVPNFDFTVNLPTNKPLNIPDDPGCCSQNYRTCSTSSSIPKTQGACAADPGKLVWLPAGDNNSTCIERSKSTTCKLHEDCCGTLVCDGLFSTIKKKQCYHAVDLCASYPDETFCKTRSEPPVSRILILLLVSRQTNL